MSTNFLSAKYDYISRNIGLKFDNKKWFMMINVYLNNLENLLVTGFLYTFFKRYMMIERKIGRLETPLVTGFLFSF